jgi:ubiquinone/menaquinone biosynthesis C-methylase UbiE
MHASVLGGPRARERDAYRPFPDIGWRNYLQRTLEVPLLIRLLRLPRGQRMLEVGCGRGIGLQALARLCAPASLTGIDIDGDLLQEAARGLRGRGVSADLFRADVRDMAFDAAAFDLVVDFGTCHHVSRPEIALREIARVLRPGGMFVHESTVAQLLAHPTRASGRPMPWHAVPDLVPYRRALLWSARKKTGVL